jgi:hypothetical protein
LSKACLLTRFSDLQTGENGRSPAIDVKADRPLSGLRVSRPQSGNHMKMGVVLKVAQRPFCIKMRQNRSAEHPQLLHKMEQNGRLAQLAKCKVELLIVFERTRRIALFIGLRKPPVSLLQSSDVFGRGERRRQRCRTALQHDSQVPHLDITSGVHCRNDNSAPCVQLQPLFRDEAEQRFPHGCRADAQLCSKLAQDQPLPGAEPTAHERGPDLLIGKPAQAVFRHGLELWGLVNQSIHNTKAFKSHSVPAANRRRHLFIQTHLPQTQLDVSGFCNNMFYIISNIAASVAQLVPEGKDDPGTRDRTQGGRREWCGL